MKVTYTGRHVDLAPAQWNRIEKQFTKLGKLLDSQSEQDARVILSIERHLCKAEVTLRYHDHPLVGQATEPDLFTAVHSAIHKIEKQAVKIRSKSRGGKDQLNGKGEEDEQPVIEAEPETVEQEVHHVGIPRHQKPMTLEEAVIAMDADRDYIVYDDHEAKCARVLVRRRDGHLDLLEL
jgi:putative sigma-54 modulation protein